MFPLTPANNIHHYTLYTQYEVLLKSLLVDEDILIEYD